MSTLQSRHRESLLITRSWLILSVVSLSWLLTILVVGPKWSALSSAEHAGILLALPLIAIAIVLARYRWTLWLTVAAMTSLGLTALAPGGSFIWAYPQTYFGYVGFLLSMLLSRRAGLVTSFLIPLGVWGIWLTGPANVVAEPFSVAGGSVQFVRALGAQLLLWWAWNSLRTQADRLDRQWDSLRETELRALAEQERSTLWRESAARVHATMLNSIKALLEVQSIDPAQLRELASQGRDAITVPPEPPRRTPVLTQIEEPVNAGIVLLTSALAGALFGGWLYSLFVSYSGVLWGVVGVGLTALGSATAIYLVMRRRRITWAWGLLAIAGPALVPWVLGMQAHACEGIGAVSGAASMAGFAIVCIGLWSGIVPFIAGLVVWSAGALELAQGAQADCRFGSTVILLNVATFLPLAVAFTFIGRYFNKRNLDALERITVAASLEQARAEALARIDEELSASVREAADAFDDIAERGSLSQNDRIVLSCLAARIRVSVQIDVGRAHGLTLAAHDLVTELSRRRIPTDVALIAYASNTSTVPRAALEPILRAGEAARGTPVRIQCLSTGDWDFLSVTVPLAAASAAALPVGTVRRFEGFVLAVHDGELGIDGIPRAVISLEPQEFASELASNQSMSGEMRPA